MTRRVTWTSMITRLQRGSIGAEKTIRNRKVTPMLPEPTLAKREAATPVLPPAWEMTPLFCEPDVAGPSAGPSHPPRRWATQSRRPRHRPNPGSRAVRGTRSPAPTGNSGTVATLKSVPRKNSGPSASRRDGPSASRKDSADLLAVTAEWLRHALRRSFLRYNVAGDLDAAVHAAMNVIEPVLEARDTELARLTRLAAAGRGTRRSVL
jgi:hypothetical protein